MKVILLQDVKGKGKKGQCIEASDGYARNFLLPRKLAVEANADNLNTMRMNDKAAAEKAAKERAEAMEISKKLREIIVTVPARAAVAVSSAPSPLPKSPTPSKPSTTLPLTSGKLFWTSPSRPSAPTP